MKRIVLTGGPGAGKTVVTDRIARANPKKYVRVPEAATQVYFELKTRWDRLDLEGKHDVQRRIYRLQREQEDRLAREHPEKVLLLDRGTIDGAAYWPEGAQAYWADLKTTLETELARYDAVIWMQTCAALGMYDGDNSNACRFEDASGAIAAGQKLIELWGKHPRLFRVEAFRRVEEKQAAVQALLLGLDA